LGQKVNPIGFRLGFNKEWKSVWFDEEDYAGKLEQDLKLRLYIENRFPNAGVGSVEIHRTPKKITLVINTSRPGMVIGKKGKEVNQLKEELKMLTGKDDIKINVKEIKRPELNARLVGENISNQIEKKVPYRRVIKKSIQATMRMDARGIKIEIGGRLGGAEIARRETYSEGSIPLHTLRANIDFSKVTAHTTYGCIGLKVWICKGESIKG